MADNELLQSTAVDANNDYNASEIQVLEGLEAVRKRPGMYIGSTSTSGLHHLVYEIVDNSIDEALAGYCTDITVQINPDNTITVVDNGRGIPVDIQAQTGRPALEVVFTVLHAGGKFGGGGYKVSGGLHGVGASVVNALSEWLTVQVHKNGNIYEMKFSRGKITQEMTIIGSTDHTGTTVTFKPDPEMFEELEYSYETLHTRMREEAFLNAGLRITIEDKRTASAEKSESERRDSMCYEGGIREFVTWLNKKKEPLHNNVIYMSGMKGDSFAELALQYDDGYQENILSFANNVHTPEGGMHETGFKAALTRVLNAYGLKVGLIKELGGEGFQPGVMARFNEGVKKLEEMGAEVIEVSLPHLPYSLGAYYIIMPSEVSSNLARYDGMRYGLRVMPPAGVPQTAANMMAYTREAGFGDEVKRRIVLGTYALSAGYYDAWYGSAQKVRTLIIDDFKKAFEKVDVLVGPTSPVTAFKFGEKTEDPMAMYAIDITTIPANLAGVPAMSIPAGLSDDGLPVGFQFLAPQQRDEVMYKPAAALEAALEESWNGPIWQSLKTPWLDGLDK